MSSLDQTTHKMQRKFILPFSRLAYWKELLNSDGLVFSLIGKISVFSDEARKAGHGGGVFLEFPVLDHESADREGYFVLTATKVFDDMAADPSSFEEFFKSDPTQKVVSFPNLSKDAVLISPSPKKMHKSQKKNGLHLQRYLTKASVADAVALMRTVAETVVKLHEDQERIKNRTPLYVSTHGTGVPWLHVRLCNSPKYYQYRDYDK